MRLVVLYGSQTGTAQEVAEQIWRESKRRGFTGPVLPMNDFPAEQLAMEKLVVFIVATTGNGNEPDNMRQFWKYLLKRNLSPETLVRLEFACLGLGDSTYPKFNYAAKRLHNRLLQLGATSIMRLGLCDDQHDYGLSAISMPWAEKLWIEMTRRFFLEAKLPEQNKAIFKYKIKVLAKPQELVDTDILRWPEGDSPLPFILKHNIRYTAPLHFQDVRFLSFDTRQGVYWKPGDVLMLRCCNSTEQVTKFFTLVKEHNLGFTPHTIVQLETIYEDLRLPVAYGEPVTIGMLAKYIWDFSARPRQYAFELLALNCEDELEKGKLLEFITIDGLDDLINYINKPRRTMIEVLQDFPNAFSKLTLQVIFELFTHIQPRSYSIASMPKSGSLDLLVAVVNYKTKLSTPRLGLCSNWLKNLPAETRVLGVIKSGTFVLPEDLRTPIIMVGPGTGIAPFRSIIQSRQIHKTNGAVIGPLVLFFGCRNKRKDHFFSKDMAQWRKSKLVQIYIAFSRDQSYKIYVQHLIKENMAKLQELIRNQNAVVLVAGSSNNMPKEVKEAFTCVLEGDEEYIEQMIKDQRYQEETWS